MKNLLERLKSGETIIADGAMGTQLAERGIDISGCVEEVNLANPEILESIARAYFEAGAEIVQTNSFGASPLKLALHGKEAKSVEIIDSAVRAVRKVIGENAYLSGSCGPSGRLLKPFGDCEESEMYASFRVQMEAFINAGVDLVCVETMTDLNEAKAAIHAARDSDPNIPIMATMTFDLTPRGFFTIMGVSIRQAVDGLSEAGADIIGSNCGNGIENMIKIAGEFVNLTDKPVIIQSNAGLPIIADGKLHYSETPEFMAQKALELKKAGVSIIGGCCGTTPEHIKAIKSAVGS